MRCLELKTRLFLLVVEVSILTLILGLYVAMMQSLDGTPGTSENISIPPHNGDGQILIPLFAPGVTYQTPVVTNHSREDSYLDAKFSKCIEALLGQLPEVAPPIVKSTPNSNADTLFIEEITLVEMPKKFILPSMKMYDWTSDLDNHIAQYK